VCIFDTVVMTANPHLMTQTGSKCSSNLSSLEFTPSSRSSWLGYNYGIGSNYKPISLCSENATNCASINN
jgi:hypothetical protein